MSQRQSVILDEEVDENYEPTQEEILEYAEFIGIDPVTESHLLWVAREGLKASLPKDWKPCQTDDGQIYYFNFATGESKWDHPCDDIYKKMYEDEKAKYNNNNSMTSAPSKQRSASEVDEMKDQQRQVKREDSTASSKGQPINNDDASSSASNTVSSKVDTSLLETPKLDDNLTAASSARSPPSPQKKFSLFEMTQAAASQKSLEKMGGGGGGSRKSSIAELDRPASIIGSAAPIQTSVTSTTSAQSARPKSKSDITASNAVAALHRNVLNATVNEGGAAEGQKLMPKKSFLGSILDHLDESIASTQNIDSIQEETSSLSRAAEPDKKEILSKAVNDRMQDIKRMFDEKERQEKSQQDAKLMMIRESLAKERESFERSERQKSEQQLFDRRKELEAEFTAKRRAEERKYEEGLVQLKNKLSADLKAAEDAERKKMEQELTDRLRHIKKEMEERYNKAIDDSGYRAAVEERKKQVELELKAEINALKDEYSKRRQELIAKKTEMEESERKDQDRQLQDLKSSFMRRKEDEERFFEKELSEVKARWGERVKMAETEYENRERSIKSQLTDVHQKSLREKELEYKRQFDKLETEWREKINKLKQQLSSEQTILEEKLIQSRKGISSQDNSSPSSSASFAGSLSVRKQDLERFIKENDQLFMQQKRRREFLEEENRMLEQMEKSVNSRRREMEAAKYNSQKASPITPMMMTADDSVMGVNQVCAGSNNTNDTPVNNEPAASEKPDREARKDQQQIPRNNAAPYRNELHAFNINQNPPIIDDDIGQLEDFDIPPIEDSRLYKDLQKNLKREQINISNTKQYLLDQTQALNSRQKEIEEQRQKWREQLENMTLNYNNNNGNNSAFYDQQRQEDDRELKVENLEYNNDGVGGIVKMLRNQSLGTAGKGLSRAEYALRRSQASQVPAHLAKWEAERRKTEDLMSRHSSWLHNFRTSLGRAGNK